MKRKHDRSLCVCVCVCMRGKDKGKDRWKSRENENVHEREEEVESEATKPTAACTFSWPCDALTMTQWHKKKKQNDGKRQTGKHTECRRLTDRQRERKGERAQESEGRRLGRARNSDQFSAGEQEMLIRMRIKIESTTKMTLAPKKPIRIIFFFFDLSNCVCGLFVGGQRRPE